MDNHVLELITQIHELCHRIEGYLDLQEDLKPKFQIYRNPSFDSKILPVPTKKATPDVGTPGEEKEELVEFFNLGDSTMLKTYERLILIDKKRCRLRLKKSGKKSFTYELRCRSGGLDVSACGVTVELAKARMREKLRYVCANPNDDFPNVPTTFTAFAKYYFENFRKEKVTPKTYQKDSLRLKSYLIPHFKETPLKKISPGSCKVLYQNIQSTGKGKTANEVYSLMSILFKGAIAHGIIQRSPLDIVLYTPYESEHGVALKIEEEKLLFDSVQNPTYALAFALCLYTGIRPNELETVSIDGNFVVAKNSKRKNGKVEYKKIPIIKSLRRYLIEPLPELPRLPLLRQKLREILPAHRLYDLRTTFYTKCDEYGVSEPARDEFVGHTSNALTSAYRDLSEDYLLKEGKKLDFWDCFPKTSPNAKS